MADDVTVDNGGLTDYNVSTDEVTGPPVRHVQRVKLAYSADGVETHVPADVNGLKVQFNNPAVVGPNDEGDTANQPPVTVAGVDGGGLVKRLKTDVNGELQVDVLTLPALAAGTANIGDVDVLTVPADPFGANADAAVAAGAAGSIQAKLRRLTTDIDAIKTAVETLDNAILGSEMQVDVLTLPAVTATDLDIRNLDVAQDDVRVGGMAAINAAVADNPVLMGGRASTAQPADVSADGNAQAMWVDQKGSPVVTMVPHIGLLGEPWSLVHEAAQYTTTQTSTVLVAGGASEKIVVTKVQIQAAGVTAGDLQLYFGTGAFARGTNRAIFDGTFKPSATLAPGVVMDGPFIAGTNGDDLMVTTSAAINPLTINVWYYVVT